MDAASGNIISHCSRSIELQVLRGHFVTGHCHVNYYIDLTYAKSQHRMAKEIAAEWASEYTSIEIETIICLGGTERIGAFTADALAQQGIMALNADCNINVIMPEEDGSGRLFFRENTLEMVQGKSIMLIIPSVSPGKRVPLAMDCIKYYGGNLVGICALFSTVPEIKGYSISSVFIKDDIPDYCCYQLEDCKMCAENQKIDGIINDFGFSRL